MRILELRGIKSLRALQVFNTLMYGLKMLPEHADEHYETFFARVAELDEAHQEKLIRLAAMFVELPKDDLEALLSFVADPNGVPYSPENLKTLGPKEILEMVVAVCKVISKIKIDLVSEGEKKN